MLTSTSIAGSVISTILLLLGVAIAVVVAVIFLLRGLDFNQNQEDKNQKGKKTGSWAQPGIMFRAGKESHINWFRF